MALYTDLTVKLVATLTGAMDLAPNNVPLDNTTRIQLASGIAANQADVMFSDRVTLGASASADLDLAGTLTDGVGGTDGVRKNQDDYARDPQQATGARSTSDILRAVSAPLRTQPL